jgi:hypothetical protein
MRAWLQRTESPSLDAMGLDFDEEPTPSNGYGLLSLGTDLVLQRVLRVAGMRGKISRWK